LFLQLPDKRGVLWRLDPLLQRVHDLTAVGSFPIFASPDSVSARMSWL